MRLRARAVALAAAAILASTAPALPASATTQSPSSEQPAQAPDRIDLDVLYVGAHPDDEAFVLATLGQWNELEGLATGVITVTRGEGGGNAVGLEEGPELGMLREAEERRAVGFAGLGNVYNLDMVDFYYTLSAPLTTEVWDEDVLERVVRVVRATRPEVIMTMNPSPTPGNHGHHQEAARLAVEAYDAAADPEIFPEQLSGEGLEPWAASRILQGGQNSPLAEAPPGPECETTPFPSDDPTARVFGAWQGRVSDIGQTFATLEWRAQIEYVSQGWAVFPPPPDDPAEIECDWLTLIDSRTPYPDPASGPNAALQGVLLPTPGGLPLGTELRVDAETFEVLPGEPFGATVHVAAGDEGLTGAELSVTAPAGWAVEQTGGAPADLEPGQSVTVEAVITPPANAAPGDRVSLAATLATGDGASGTNETAVAVTSPVAGELVPRAEEAQFHEWARGQDLAELEVLIASAATLGSGRGEEIGVEVTNHGSAGASGTVHLDLPAGFEAAPAEQGYDGLAPGDTTTVTFEVTNTDASLPTSNRAEGFGYPFQIATTSDSGTDIQDAVLELVPTAAVPYLDAAPAVDGIADHTEYPGAALDTSTMWEGEEATAEDVSAATRVTATDDALFVYVDVTDEAMGTVLPPVDCKRHWRTDSVEITIDPRGTSPNTASTFKAGIFPVTDDPAAGDPPCFQRDADNHQGPGEETAPGMEVASVVRGARYTVEAMIPFDVLPDTVDPERMGLNVLVYDSDTQDLTGQTRVGWSTFPGVQAAPFRWGIVTVPGLEAAEPALVEPTLPDTAALSVDSPQSIEQSSADGVPLGGGPGLPADALRVTTATLGGGEVTVELDSATAGQANLFVWDGEQILGETRGVELPGGPATLTVPFTGEDAREVLIAFMTEEGTLAVSHLF